MKYYFNEDKSMRLYNGDCFELLDRLDINNVKVDLIITDPPYLHNKGGGKTHGTEGKSKIANSSMFNFDSPMMKDMSSFGENEVNLLLDKYKKIMNKMNCYIFCNDTLIPYYLNWALANKKKYTILTWEKPLSILNRNRFSQNLEYIVRIYDNGTALNLLDIDNEPHKKEYYSKNRRFVQVKGKDKLHPVQKPIEYINGLIELSSKEGDLILDSFMGSATTGEACKSLNRRFIGIELDEKYFDIAVDRIKE
ncbi:MAG: DNA-methyltransferase [Cetobacterium sp.]